MGKRSGRTLLHAAAGLAAASFGLSTACGKSYCGWGVGQDEPVDTCNPGEGDTEGCDAGPAREAGRDAGPKADAGESDGG
jgi:hypothetical protein